MKTSESLARFFQPEALTKHALHRHERLQLGVWKEDLVPRPEFTVYMGKNSERNTEIQVKLNPNNTHLSSSCLSQQL